MHHDRYEAIADDEHEIFEFLSAGPNGTIKKVVRYKLIAGPVYNLGFGDWDEKAQTIRDDVRTNNEDRAKVLATVAFTLIDFMQFHPTATVFAKGSTPARTRLYQMGIHANWYEISLLLDVQGFGKNGWEPFRQHENYKAFMVNAKGKL